MAFLDDIETLISGSTVAGSTTGWLLFKGHLPDSSTIGDKAVALIETAGGGVMGRVALEEPGLQLVVRGDPQNTTASTSAYADAQAKLTQARDVLHEYSGSSGTGSQHYAGIWCLNQAFLGFDEIERPIFVANFHVMRQTT